VSLPDRVPRERGLMTLRAGKVTIHDLENLKALAEFENGYLDQRGVAAGSGGSPPDRPTLTCPSGREANRD
jgi:hypothetical protein